MSYTKQQRKALANAFTATLQHLSETHVDSDSKHEFICHALSRAVDLRKVTRSRAALAQGVIMQRLDWEDTFTNWLIKQNISSKAIKADRDMNMGRKAQAARKAWLESLIQEFSS